MLAALGQQEILILGHQDPFPVVIGVGIITGEAPSKVGHELFSNFEDGLPSRMEVYFK